MGYLFFGGRHLTLRVTQLFVAKRFREHGIASKLLAELEAYAGRNQFLTIRARVAADLEANAFWEKAGFELFRQEKGAQTVFPRGGEAMAGCYAGLVQGFDHRAL